MKTGPTLGVVVVPCGVLAVVVVVVVI